MTDTDGPQISRRERKKRDTHRRILDAALDLMAGKPYDEVRIDDICKAADVANATFFLHFPNKSTLAMALNADVAAKIAAQIEGHGLSATERLHRLLEAYLAEWETHRHLMRQVVIEFAGKGGPDWTAGGVSQGILSLAQSIIRDGQQSGEFFSRISPETAALALVAAWKAIAISWPDAGGADQAAEAHRQTLGIFLHGIEAERTVRQHGLQQ